MPLNPHCKVDVLHNITITHVFYQESVITPSKADEFKKDLLDPIRDIHIGLIVAVGVFGKKTLLQLYPIFSDLFRITDYYIVPGYGV